MTAVHPDPLTICVQPEVRRVLEAKSSGRRLVIDWWASRCCGGAPVGDLFLRWEPAERPPGDDLVRLGGAEPVDAFAVKELASLVAPGGLAIELGGFGPWRRPRLVLADAARWLQFLAAAPVRPRSH